jgi:hypothetical protein
VNAAELRDAVAYAPHARQSNPEIVGSWTREGFYLCADCGLRLTLRGFVMVSREIVYRDGVRGTCIGCEPLRDENGALAVGEKGTDQ